MTGALEHQRHHQRARSFTRSQRRGQHLNANSTRTAPTIDLFKKPTGRVTAVPSKVMAKVTRQVAENDLPLMPTLADMPAQRSSHDYVRMGRELAREACVGSATAALLASALGFALAAMSSTRRHAFTWAARAIAHVYRREVAAKLAGLHARRSGTRAADPPACQPAHPRSSTSQRPYRPGVDGSDGGRRRLGDEGSKGDTSAQPLREADFAMVRRDLDRNAPVSRKEVGGMRDGQRGCWTGVVGYATPSAAHCATSAPRTPTTRSSAHSSSGSSNLTSSCSTFDPAHGDTAGGLAQVADNGDLRVRWLRRGLPDRT